MVRNALYIPVMLAMYGLVAMAICYTASAAPLWALLLIALVTINLSWSTTEGRNALMIAQTVNACAGMAVIGYALYVTHDMASLWALLIVGINAINFPTPASSKKRRRGKTAS